MVWKPGRESLYTPARSICPHPEWWTAENPMSTECEISELVGSLVRATQPELVIEVGSHYGVTSEKIGRAIELNEHGRFISLEIDLGMYQSAMHRCSGFPIEFICVDSHIYIPEQKIDFLFVDGGDDRLSDVKHFLPYMSPRGVIVIHDVVAPRWKKEAEEAVKLCGGDHLKLDSPRGVLIIRLGEDVEENGET